MACGLALGLLAPGPLAAQDPEAGRAIAERHCARCHAVGAEGESPVRHAPPFRTLGADWPVGHLQEALAEGIVVGHSDPPMPEFALSPEEIGDLIAYLESITAK